MAMGKSHGLGPAPLPTGVTVENLERATKGGTLDESPGSADTPATTSSATAVRRAETRT